MDNKVICFFNSNKAWGGGEKWHLDTALRLQKNNFKVVMFAYVGKELYTRALSYGIDVYPIKISGTSFLNPFKIRFIANKLKECCAQTIIMNLSADVKTAGIAAKKAGVKNIIYRRGLALPVKNSFINRYLFNRVLTKIITNSFDIKRKLLVNHPYLEKRNKIEIIHNGVDLTYYSKQNNTSKNKGKKIIIGNVGRMVDQKAQHYLIELASLLKEKNLSFEIKIIGTGKLEDKLKQMAKEKSVSDCVQFLGFIENLDKFYQDIDIFMLTSQHEGTSNALIEAMAWKNPVITFNISSMPEMVQNNINGFVVEWDNMNALFEKTKLLIADPDLRKSMGKKSYEIVSQKFNIEKNIKNFIDLIK